MRMFSISCSSSSRQRGAAHRVPALSAADGVIDNATQAKDLPPADIQHV